MLCVCVCVCVGVGVGVGVGDGGGDGWRGGGGDTHALCVVFPLLCLANMHTLALADNHIYVHKCMYMHIHTLDFQN